MAGVLAGASSFGGIGCPHGNGPFTDLRWDGAEGCEH